MTYEVRYNDLFVLGTRVLRQKKGLAIGGMISAQRASLYCMYKEHMFYSQPWARACSYMAKFFPPSSVPKFPARFRDNLMGVAKRTVDVQRLKAFLAKVYGLLMQLEQWGPSMAVLEAVLTLVDQGRALTLGLR